MATLYYGIGGGGDTNSAIIRAITDNTVSNDNKYVIGAGYRYAEYVNALTNGEKNRKKEPKNKDKYVYDRLPYTKKTQDDTLIDNYLNEALSTNGGNVEKELYNLSSITPLTKKEYFDEVDPTVNIVAADKYNPKIIDGNELLDEKGNTIVFDYNKTSLGYRTLKEETDLLIILKNDIDSTKLKEHIYMCFTTDNFEATYSDKDDEKKKADQIKKDNQLKKDVPLVYKTLKNFIKDNRIEKIVTMDFGADIFDFKSIARDTANLLMITKIIEDLIEEQKTDATILIPELILEVYGPGVDAHAPINEVINNLNSVKPKGDIINVMNLPVQYKEFMKKLIDNKDYLDIMKPGRATGNYCEAFRLCDKSMEQVMIGGKKYKNKKGGNLEENLEFINSHLKARHDFTSVLNPTKQKEVVNQANQIIKSGICDFAQIYIYRINKDNIQEFINYLGSIPIAKRGYEILNIRKTGTSGGKNKSQNYKKTNDKIKVGKREAVIYKGQRGGKYIKQKGLYINIKKLKIV